MPTIMRILQAEDMRIERGRSLSCKERDYVDQQLELGSIYRMSSPTWRLERVITGKLFSQWMH
jgi:hypothetical protein